MRCRIIFRSIRTSADFKCFYFIFKLCKRMNSAAVKFSYFKSFGIDKRFYRRTDLSVGTYCTIQLIAEQIPRTADKRINFSVFIIYRNKTSLYMIDSLVTIINLHFISGILHSVTNILQLSADRCLCKTLFFQIKTCFYYQAAGSNFVITKFFFQNLTYIFRKITGLINFRFPNRLFSEDSVITEVFPKTLRFKRSLFFRKKAGFHKFSDNIR